MKLYLHRAIIYMLASIWPKLFLRYFDDYYKRYTIRFLSKVKKTNVKESIRQGIQDIKEGRVTKVKDLDNFFKEV